MGYGKTIDPRAQEVIDVMVENVGKLQAGDTFALEFQNELAAEKMIYKIWQGLRLGSMNGKDVRIRNAKDGFKISREGKNIRFMKRHGFDTFQFKVVGVPSTNTQALHKLGQDKTILVSGEHFTIEDDLDLSLQLISIITELDRKPQILRIVGVQLKLSDLDEFRKWTDNMGYDLIVDAEIDALEVHFTSIVKADGNP